MMNSSVLFVSDFEVLFRPGLIEFGSSKTGFRGFFFLLLLRQFLTDFFNSHRFFYADLELVEG